MENMLDELGEYTHDFCDKCESELKKDNSKCPHCNNEKLMKVVKMPNINLKVSNQLKFTGD